MHHRAYCMLMSSSTRPTLCSIASLAYRVCRLNSRNSILLARPRRIRLPPWSSAVYKTLSGTIPQSYRFQQQQRGFIDLKTMSFHPNSTADYIIVNELTLPAIVGHDAWHRPKLQPVTVSLRIKTSVGLAGSTDHLAHSINYGSVCKAATKAIQENEFSSLEHLAESLAGIILGDELRAEWVNVKVEQPKSLLRADAAGLEIIRRKDGVREGRDKITIKDLKVATIIGVNACERLERQQVIINLTLYKPESSNSEPAFASIYDHKKILDVVVDHVEASAYLTIEALVTGIAKVVCLDCDVDSVTVRAAKPSALALARSSEVEISRQKSYFHSLTAASTQKKTHDVFIAFGSNLGDKFALIRDALAELNKRGIRVLKTSSLYESLPMYVEDQDTFLNGVCQAQTTLTPVELLHELQDIENSFGRVKLVDKGPRNIDLDILLYDTQVEFLTEPDLTIPHASMLEREFVLRPLCDIAPDLPHPQTSVTFASHLSALPGPSTVYPRVLLSPSIPSLQPNSPTRPTHIMAIINLTPDSFSDGGIYNIDNIEATVNRAVKAGASIVDLGGMSTRPFAEDVLVTEELERVMPAIKAIRSSSDPAVRNVTISVDTFRASVARAAVNAGADLINDISGGLHDADMISTAIELDVPIVLMHMRGTPKTMNSLADYPDGVIETVGRELEERLDAALNAGIKRWKIILDPGLGFAKTREHNLQILRDFGKLRARKALNGVPWLLGPSRKRFIGDITGVSKPDERQWGTGAAVTACVAGGADIVRVHDVDEMVKVAKMADAVWRQ
ncbi:trifunctional dihydropteroate synthetase [Orbilia brochopaga]|uniref:Folic acid synthesis protein FOL1 n=1 Tax=Orbilia brochopaga TaxID=3140254 RepID=A0AAV9U8C9_9PEZI